jgi:glycosyltransferase involved in cell wall biosynthesis
MRAMKYAVGLTGARPDIELGFAYQGRTLSEWYGSGDELFKRWWDLGEDPERMLPVVIKEFRPDVIHSHNLPDTLTVLANEMVRGTIPVIHDVHDLQSLRRTPYENGFPEPRSTQMLERRAIEESAAVITVSDELIAEIGTRYRLPGHTLVFPNYALLRDLPPLAQSEAHRNGIPPKLVYQGTLSTNGGHYDLREIFTALVAEGATLEIYPSREVPEYRELAEATPGLTYHDTVDPATLLRALSRYDYGWAGFNNGLNSAHIDTALPNKLFEYLGAGLPVLTLGHTAIRRFLRTRGLGIALASPTELAPELARRDLEKLRRRVAGARHTLTIEANIQGVADIYENVIPTAHVDAAAALPA